MTKIITAPKKKWSFSEWIANFVDADIAWYDQAEFDDWDDSLPGGEAGGADDFYDDVDSGLLESLVIIGLAGALAFLVYYRQQRQQDHQRNLQQGQGQPQPQPQPVQQQHADVPRHDGVDQQQQQLQQQQQQQGQQEPGQEDRGLFPADDDPEFYEWVAGGVAR